MFNSSNFSKRYRILIIDDDEELGTTLKDFFAAYRYDVDSVTNGFDGIALHHSFPYDVIITDILMPDMDGLEVIMQVKESNESCKVVAISGGGYFDSQSYLFMAKELGASLVYSKPFESEALLTGIENLIGNNILR